MGDLSDVTRYTTFGTLIPSDDGSSFPKWYYDILPVDVCDKYVEYS